jgi:hypothetical protein
MKNMVIYEKSRVKNAVSLVKLGAIGGDYSGALFSQNLF